MRCFCSNWMIEIPFLWGLDLRICEKIQATYNDMDSQTEKLLQESSDGIVSGFSEECATQNLGFTVPFQNSCEATFFKHIRSLRPFTTPSAKCIILRIGKKMNSRSWWKRLVQRANLTKRLGLLRNNKFNTVNVNLTLATPGFLKHTILSKGLGLMFLFALWFCNFDSTTQPL